MMKATTIAIPGLKIAYKTWGDAHLPPLLAIHGWLDNANSFNLLAPYLAKQFHLIALDLPGHGLSSHLPLGSYYHFLDGIFYVLEFIKAFPLERVHLLGHSLGACLASLIAGVAPERILSLALIEGLGPFSNPENTCCEQLAHYAKQIWQEFNSQGKSYPTKILAAKARAKQGYLAQEYVEILGERGLKKKDNAYYWRHDKRLLSRSPLRLTEQQVLSCLEQIQVQTCLIVAEQGFQFEDNLISKREQAVKYLQTHHIPGGHHIHMEKPELVSQYLKAFYATIS